MKKDRDKGKEGHGLNRRKNSSLKLIRNGVASMVRVTSGNCYTLDLTRDKMEGAKTRCERLSRVRATSPIQLSSGNYNTTI